MSAIRYSQHNLISNRRISMSNNQKEYRGAKVGDFIAPDQLERIKQYALGPQTLEGKLALYNKLAAEHEVVNPRDPKRKDRRSKLGTFINKLFNTQMELPAVGRRQQIGKAIKFGKEYLKENPGASVYFAAAMGAAEEYREWMALIGDLKPEDQLAIMNSEAAEESQQ
jgi:hypothetical protein